LSATSFSSPCAIELVGGSGAVVGSHGSGSECGGVGLGGGAKRSQATSRGRHPGGSMEAAGGGERSGLAATWRLRSRRQLADGSAGRGGGGGLVGGASRSMRPRVAVGGVRRKKRDRGGASTQTSTK
jgi:hypothetical protein